MAGQSGSKRAKGEHGGAEGGRKKKTHKPGSAGRGNKEGGRRIDQANDPKHVNRSIDSSLNARKTVDRETMQYFFEISNLLGEGGPVMDPEERATLCANALEETHGKELQLACDQSCSRVLETLLLSSDIISVTSFLHRSSLVFDSIALNSSGSHVAEVALKCAASAFRDCDSGAAWYKTLKQALSRICQVVGERSVEMMCSCYGSHVLRSLLFFFSGTMLEALSNNKGGRHLGGLASRLIVSKPRSQVAKAKEYVFPDLLESLVNKLLQETKSIMGRLRVDNFAGLVLQAILKVLEGNTEAVTNAIANILQSDSEKPAKKGNVLESVSFEEVREIMFHNTGSHLVEVMLEVAPDTIHLEMFERFFRQHLCDLSLHQSANFVVQALISSSRHQGQVDMIFGELGASFSRLIKERRSGVIAILLAASGRFSTHQREACRLIANAMNPNSNSLACLVPRMLFLEDYARVERSIDWRPAFNKKMSVLGCAMLQMIFTFSKECNQQFCSSMVAMEAGDVLEIVKDAGGCHVIEGFLSSDAPHKHKQRIITKLKGKFAEISVYTVSSFTIEKCFSVADSALKETIALELASVQTELSNTKHGPYLLSKFDVKGYVEHPDRWRQRVSSNQGILKSFTEIFNPDSKKSFTWDKFNSEENDANMRERSSNIVKVKLHGEHLESNSAMPAGRNVVLDDPSLNNAMAQLGFSGQRPVLKEKHKRRKETARQSEKLTGMGHKLTLDEEDVIPEEGRKPAADEIDLLFKEKPKLENSKRKKLRAEAGLDFGNTDFGTKTEDTSLKVVMDAIEGGLKKSKNRKHDLLSNVEVQKRKRVQAVMV